MEYPKETIIDKLNEIGATIKNAEKGSYEVNNIVMLRYGFDSLNFMNFITAIENKFGIEFEDSVTYEELNNFENLIHLIKAKCNYH